MIVVVDKQVVKHLVETGDGLLEIPVRVSFEYHIEDSTFIDGSMTRKYLYNRPAVRRHFPRLDDEALDGEISRTVDRSLEERLRFAGHASGSVELFPAAPEPESPQLILPGEE